MTEKGNWQRTEVAKIYIGRGKGYPQEGRKNRGKIKGEGGTASENTTLPMVHALQFQAPSVEGIQRLCAPGGI